MHVRVSGTAEIQCSDYILAASHGVIKSGPWTNDGS